MHKGGKGKMKGKPGFKPKGDLYGKAKSKRGTKATSV